MMNLNTIVIRHNKEPFKNISHMCYRVYLKLDDGTEHEIPSVISYHQEPGTIYTDFRIVNQAIIEV